MSKIINGVSYSWSQPICMACYRREQPRREPHRITAGYRVTERCCFCGKATKEGVYYRVDPEHCRFPTPEEV